MFSCEDQNTVDVVGHDDERVSLHGRIVVWQLGPRRGDHGASSSQRYAVRHHLTKETELLGGADGDEVGAGGGVVKFGKSKR